MGMNRRAFLAGGGLAAVGLPAAALTDLQADKTCSVDVCVAGGGPAGFIAAIAAARNGAKTVLVEQYGFPGGMATAGLVGPISKFNCGGRRVVGGIPAEFIERLRRDGGAITDLPSGNIPFDAECYKRVAREMLEEAGVKSLWQSSVSQPEFGPDGSMKACRLVTAGFISRLEAKCFIDCTGSGALVGNGGSLGRWRSPIEKAQPLSLCFILGGVDTSKRQLLMAEDGVKYADQTLRGHLSAAVAKGRLKAFGGPWALWGSTIRPGFVSVNCTRASGNLTDPEDAARATTALRRDIPHVIDVFRRSDPVFKDAFLVQTAVATGFRESRELVALHRMTADEILSGADLPDAIALGAHPMDRHCPGGNAQVVTFLKRPYPIALRSLISRTCPNLLAAGGLVAAEPDAFASMRVQAQCMAMGQAAGTAAAWMLERKVPVQRIDGVAVRAVLERQGALTRPDNA